MSQQSQQSRRHRKARCGTTVDDADLARFVERLRARLEAGARAYGNSSFTRPVVELVDEIQQELEDVAAGACRSGFGSSVFAVASSKLVNREEQMAEHEVRVRSWVRASDDEVRSGLLGYLSVHYGDLVLDGITLRRTSDGRFALSFPARTDRAGRKHAFVRPTDDAARKAIEREILEQLGQVPTEVPHGR